MLICLFFIGICALSLFLGKMEVKSDALHLKKEAESFCYEKILKLYAPNLYHGTGTNDTKTMAECVMDSFFPLNEYVKKEVEYETLVESELSYEVVLEREGSDELFLGEDSAANGQEQQPQPETEAAVREEPPVTEEIEAAETTMSVAKKTEKLVDYPIEKLNDFDYLIQNFYSVDSTTTTDGRQLNAENMLGMDMSLSHDATTPQILIYHTHSQEGFVDTNYEDTSTTIVGVGEYLAQILREQYGYQVIHDTGIYDIPEHDKAYSVAAPHIQQILAENPGIEVVIDLHRNGILSDTKTTTNIDGTEMAKIMFFNGLSHTTAHGDIAYLANPNLDANLAFSFQMQLTAAQYYPDYSRKIYLKGYRYNMHFLPKSTLIEVGDQNNTYEEAKNAMVPLADIMDKVIHPKN
ncbi:MAG: stage II sporulation protein P [Roseburia sp.]|nr:stage II sporulation protein P [Roseburia sp.]